MRALSQTMIEALALLIHDYDEAVAMEAKLWGSKSAARIAGAGIEMPRVSYRTMNALVSRGYALISSSSPIRGEALRRGSFGRWIGGTKTWTDVVVRYVPTEDGRQALDFGSAF